MCYIREGSKWTSVISMQQDAEILYYDMWYVTVILFIINQASHVFLMSMLLGAQHSGIRCIWN